MHLLSPQLTLPSSRIGSKSLAAACADFIACILLRSGLDALALDMPVTGFLMSPEPFVVVAVGHRLPFTL